MRRHGANEMKNTDTQTTSIQSPLEILRSTRIWETIQMKWSILRRKMEEMDQRPIEMSKKTRKKRKETESFPWNLKWTIFIENFVFILKLRSHLHWMACHAAKAADGQPEKRYSLGRESNGLMNFECAINSILGERGERMGFAWTETQMHIIKRINVNKRRVDSICNRCAFAVRVWKDRQGLYRCRIIIINIKTRIKLLQGIHFVQITMRYPMPHA